MSNKYHRLCAENRKVIANMKQAGKTQTEIAQAIGFSQSAISNELSRNHGERGYRPSQAHRLATETGRQTSFRELREAVSCSQSMSEKAVLECFIYYPTRAVLKP